VKAQLWEQDKIVERPTDNMTNDEKKIHWRALKHLEKDFDLDKEEDEEEIEKDDE
jgi:hypothetical protein